MSKCLEILGIVCGVIGFIAAIITCALPMWKVTAFTGANITGANITGANITGANIITAQITWEGLWMNCVLQRTGQMQCKTYDSRLALSLDLQPARAMMVISIILGILGVLISIVGANCMKRGAARAKVMIIPGIFFILAGILVLISVCWIVHTIIQDLYNSLPVSVRMKLGASIYIGWASAALFLIGGALLCSRCSSEERYKPPRLVYTKADGEPNNV